jgi:hypothetical protein
MKMAWGFIENSVTLLPSFRTFHCQVPASNTGYFYGGVTGPVSVVMVLEML